jgi:hypothetical protein
VIIAKPFQRPVNCNLATFLLLILGIFTSNICLSRVLIVVWTSLFLVTLQRDTSPIRLISLWVTRVKRRLCPTLNGKKAGDSEPFVLVVICAVVQCVRKVTVVLRTFHVKNMYYI